MIKTIPHNQPTIGLKEAEAVKLALVNKHLSTGKLVDNFEGQLALKLRINKKNVVAVNSGSAALFLILKLFYKTKSRIALPSYSCSSIYQAVKLANHETVFYDVKPNSVEFVFPDNSSYDTIIVPHLFGLPCNLQSVPVERCIEDICQSIGAKRQDTLVGSHGRFSVCSFGATKPFTVGGNGGAVICKSSSDSDIVRDYLNYDMKSNLYDGFNFVMSDINAAIGAVQLHRYFVSFIKKRNMIINKYLDAGINLLCPKIATDKSVGFRAIVNYEDHAKRDYMKLKLLEDGISSIIPIERKEIMKAKNMVFTGAEKNADCFLSLPCYPSLTSKKVNTIIRSYKKHENNFN